MTLTNNKSERKEMPMARGLLDYFPLACAEVAHVSYVANEQHNPGEEMHWAKEKSTDHADCIVRHLVERGTMDTDGLRHSAKVAWRGLALLEIELEKELEDAKAVEARSLRGRAKFTPCGCYACTRYQSARAQNNAVPPDRFGN